MNKAAARRKILFYIPISRDKDFILLAKVVFFLHISKFLRTFAVDFANIRLHGTYTNIVITRFLDDT
jgi:hypothetical protein